METGGEGGGGEAERRGRSELGRLLEAIGSSEVLERRIPLIKQLEEFSADDLGLILQALLASWIDSTYSGVSHCILHRSILQVALKFSDLDITDYLGQFFTLGAKASSWCEKHLQWSVKSTDQSGAVQEEEHNRLHLEINSLSFSLSTKLLGVAAKCITVLGLEVAAGEGGKGVTEQECVLNMSAEVEEQQCVLNMAADLAVGPRTKGVRRMAPWSLTPVVSPPPQKASRRRCTQCGREKTPQWRHGPDGPGILCNACGQQFKEGQLLHSNSRRRRPSKKRRLSSKENSAAGNDKGASLDAFFLHKGLEVSWKAERAEEEELEWLFNKDAFPSMETMAVEVEEAPALDSPRARTKGRRRVTATETTSRQTKGWRHVTATETSRQTKGRRRATSTETTSRQANLLPHCDLRAEKKTARRCTHCATVKTPQWRDGPEGPYTLCNACGVVFRKKGRLLPEYRPASSPTFSPLLHSNTDRRALQMHCQNKTTSACRGEAHGEPMEGQLLPPANGPASSTPVQRQSPLRQERLQGKEETPAAGDATAEACRGEEKLESVEEQLLPERPPVDRAAFSLVYHRRRRMLDRSRKSEEETLRERPPVYRPTFALVYHRRVIERSHKSEEETFRAIAKDRRAELAAALLSAMDD